MKTNLPLKEPVLPRFLGSALLGLCLLASARQGAAATVTWTGLGANANWSTAGNWSPGAPNPSDALIFDGSAQLLPNNDLTAGTAFTGLSFAPTAGSFDLEGNAINLSGLVENDSSAPQIINMPLNLIDLTTFNTANGDLSLSNAVTTTTNLSPNFFKTGPGRLDLYWNWFANGVTNATLIISNGVVGLNNGPTSSNPGSQINNNYRITMSGGSLELDYASYWNAPTILFTTNSSVGVASGLGVDFAGTMGSPGYVWTKSGLGTLSTTLWQTNLNVVQASAIIVAEGTLADFANQYPTWGNNYYAQWGTNPITVATGATLVKQNGGIVLNPIELQGGTGTGTGTLVAGFRGGNGADNSNATCVATFVNTITLDADSTLGVTFGKAVFAGNITGPGALEKVGGNTMVLGGTNTYGGNTTVSAGRLQLGSSFALPGGPTNGNVQLNTGATLDLNGFNASVNGLNDDGMAGALVDNSSATSPATLAIGGNDQPINFTSPIKNTGAALSIVKVGSSTATLLGANTYGGSNVVMGGTLEINIPTGTSSNGMVVVADGATLTLHKTVGPAALKPTAVTLGNSGATTLNLDLGGFGNPSTAVLNAIYGTGTLTAGGTVTINISGNGNVMQAGQFPLIKYLVRAGGGTFILGALPNQVVANLVTNTANKSIDLQITSSPVTKWVGNISADWDIATTLNWSVLGVATNYHDGVGVVFDDTAATNFINLTTALSPGGTLVNSSNNYTFGGPGSLAAGDLTKSGSGTLTLLTPNTYNNTILSGGTVQVDTGGTTASLGLGNIADDATLIFNRGDAITIYGNITGVGAVTQQGTNTLTLSGANTYSGGTLVSQGVVQLGQGMNQAAGSLALGIPAGSTPLVTVASGAALDMNDTRISTLNNPVIISGPGTGVNPNVGALYSSGSGYLWFGSGTPPTVTNLQLAADASIGGNNDWFEIGSHGASVGGIDGKSHVLTKVGSSTIILNQNALSALSKAVVASGRYVLTTSNPFGSGALVVLDNNAAIDTWGNGNAGWGGVTVPNNFQVTTNGGQIRNTQGAWYNHPNFDTYTGAFALDGILTLQSSSTYYGNGNAGYAYIRTYGTMTFPGPMSGLGGVTKIGPYTATLSGANTYTGPTVVSAGTLLTTTLSQGGGAYTNQDGATLDVAVNPAFPTLPMSTFALGSTTGAVLSLERVVTLTTNAPITATNLVLVGASSILPPGSAFAIPGQYPLIKYGTVSGGGSLFVGGPGARGISAYISNNVANQTMDLVVPATGNPVIWVGNLGSTWDIATTANWSYLSSSTTYQQNAIPGDAVQFDDTASSTTVNVSTPVTPSVVTVSNSTKNFTFTGTNITGPAVLVKSGSGKLTLSSGNYYLSGGTFINGGTITLGNDAALNNYGGIVTVANGGTLDLNNFNPSGITVNASGAGVGGLGAIVDNYSPSANNTRGPGTINMMGDLWVGGTNRWSLRNGARTLNCPTNGYSLIKVGPNMVDLAGATVSTNLGDIVILAGTFSHRNANSMLGNPAKYLKVGAGATLNFNANPPVSVKPIIATNTATIQTDSSGMTIGNPITLDSGTAYLDANFNNTVTYTNVISGAGGLRMNYNSQITFTAPNTYTGNTEVRTGPNSGPAAYLRLSGNGSIANSPSIRLNGNGPTNYLNGPILDASARTDGTLTLIGQTLRGDTGSSIKGNVVAGSGSTIWPGGIGYIQTMAFSNALTFQAGSTCQVDINTDTLSNDLFIVTGTLTNGGTLQVNHLGTSGFAGGQSFNLFTAGGYAGSFASITPATPGTGLLWDTSALATSGTLKIIAAPSIEPPYLDSLGRLVLQVTNTTVGRNYVLESATNLVPPIVWTPVSTNAGTGGTITNLVSPSPETPEDFFRYLMQ